MLNSLFPEAIEDIRVAFAGLLPAERIVIFEVPPLLSWENPSNAWRRRAAELIRECFLSELQPDVVHVSSLFEGAKQCDATHSIGTFGSGARIAVTLYDLIPLLSPETYLGQGWTKNWYMNKVENLKRADFLLSISEHSRREAIDALGIDSGRIVGIFRRRIQIFFIHAMKTAQASRSGFRATALPSRSLCTTGRLNHARIWIDC